MKVYHGRRSEHGCAVDVEEEGEVCVLPPRPDSRSDLEWDSVSGQLSLALALATDVLGSDKQARHVYQKLRSNLISKLPHQGWSISEGQLRAAIDAIEQTPHRRTP
jgi:hypothetical protein